MYIQRACTHTRNVLQMCDGKRWDAAGCRYRTCLGGCGLQIICSVESWDRCKCLFYFSNSVRSGLSM